MDIEQLRASWQELGSTDPLWAILSEEGRQGGRWEEEPFWQSGIATVDWVVRHLDGLGALPRTEAALDFGCGIGRLTQALARHFAKVTGVDIADSMLERARAANRHGERVQYVLNTRPDLSLVGDASVDFVLTLLVLQHMRPDYSAAYLREFLRVLRPGGVLMFNLPIAPVVPERTVPRREAAPVRALVEQPASLRAHCSVVPAHRDAAEQRWMWCRVDVFNPGPSRWAARGDGAVEVGVRFQRLEASIAGPTVWSPLSRDLGPGESETVMVLLRAPAVAGPYLLCAMPCVRRSWIAHPQNVPSMAFVNVGFGTAADRAAEAPPLPVAGPPDGKCLIEVYGTPLPDAIANLERAGGDVLDVTLDEWAGHAWISAHFVVRRRPM